MSTKTLAEMSGEELLRAFSIKTSYARAYGAEEDIQAAREVRAELLRRLKAAGEGWIPCGQWAGVAGESVQVMAEGYDVPLTAIYFEKALFNSVPGSLRLQVYSVRPLPPVPAKEKS